MVRIANGEKLPEPEPPHWQSPGQFDIDPFNPVVIAIVFIVGAVLRAALGRLVGSAATGGVVGFLAWFLVGSIGAALIVGVLAFLVAAFVDLMPAGGSRGTRGGWSGGGGSSDWSSGSSSSDSGSFSGGGGSFGGGGASGSW
jgi:uncharacterized protein